VRLAELRLAELRLAELRLAEVRLPEVRPAKVRPAEVRVDQARPAEVCLLQIRLNVGIVFPPLIPRLHALPQNCEMLFVCHAPDPSSIVRRL
jgi:hypothetical protein